MVHLLSLVLFPSPYWLAIFSSTYFRSTSQHSSSIVWLFTLWSIEIRPIFWEKEREWKKSRANQINFWALFYSPCPIRSLRTIVFSSGDAFFKIWAKEWKISGKGRKKQRKEASELNIIFREIVNLARKEGWVFFCCWYKRWVCLQLLFIRRNGKVRYENIWFENTVLELLLMFASSLRNLSVTKVFAFFCWIV